MNHVLELMTACTGRTPDVTHEPTQKGDMRDTYADTSLARDRLGFVPQTELEDGIRAEHDWLSLTPVGT
jgi:UDP-glucose 4-epimerase